MDIYDVFDVMAKASSGNAGGQCGCSYSGGCTAQCGCSQTTAQCACSGGS